MCDSQRVCGLWLGVSGKDVNSTRPIQVDFFRLETLIDAEIRTSVQWSRYKREQRGRSRSAGGGRKKLVFVCFNRLKVTEAW